MNDLQIAISLVEGKITVDEFMKQAMAEISLFAALQDLILPGTTRCVQKLVEGKLITNQVAYNVKEYFAELYAVGTLDARVNIFAAVRDIVLSKYPNTKVDNSLIEKFAFILNNTPNYIGGVKAEKVLERIYDNIKIVQSTAYIKLVKCAFTVADKPPRWIQTPEWPIDHNWKPLMFLYEKKINKEEKEYIFKKLDGDEIISIKQSY